MTEQANPDQSANNSTAQAKPGTLQLPAIQFNILNALFATGEPHELREFLNWVTTEFWVSQPKLDKEARRFITRNYTTLLYEIDQAELQCRKEGML